MNRPIPPAKGPPKDEANHRRWSSRRRFPELRAHAATIIDTNNDNNDDDINDNAAIPSLSRDELPPGVVALPKPKRFISRSGVPQPSAGPSPASTTASSYHMSNPAYLTDRLTPSLHGRSAKRTVYMPSPSGYSASIPTAASTASLLGAPYPFGPPVYQAPPLTGASSSSSFPDTPRAPVPYFSFAPGSGIVRSFADGGQPLQHDTIINNNGNTANNNTHNDSKQMDSKQQSDGSVSNWTGRTFDPRSPMSNYRAALLSRNGGADSAPPLTERSKRVRAPIRGASASASSSSSIGNGSSSARSLPPFIARTASSAKHLISSHTAFDPYTEANPFDAPHQVQLRWHREHKERMIAGPFKAPTPATARDAIAVDYYMNSADEYVKRAERMLVRSRARAAAATFRRQLAESQQRDRAHDSHNSNMMAAPPTIPRVDTPPQTSGYAAAMAAVHAAEAI